ESCSSGGFAAATGPGGRFRKGGVAPSGHMSALVEIREVSKAFGGVQAVTKVSLDVQKGEIFSVIGPNGAGKTTVLNMISGFYHPDTDRIALEGRDVTALAPSPIAELGVPRTFQNI